MLGSSLGRLLDKFQTSGKIFEHLTLTVKIFAPAVFYYYVTYSSHYYSCW